MDIYKRTLKTFSGIGLGVLLIYKLFFSKAILNTNENLNIFLGIIFLVVLPCIFIFIAGLELFLVINGIIFLIFILILSGILGFLRTFE